MAAVVLAVMAAFPACATIAHGSKQKIAVSSTPPAATVSVNGERQSGATPLTLNLPRRTAHVVRIELEGYQPYTVELRRKLDGWFWGDVVLLSPLAVIIDASSGAMYKLTPKDVSATLTQAAASRRGAGDTLHIAVVLDPDPSLEKIGSLQPVAADQAH